MTRTGQIKRLMKPWIAIISLVVPSNAFSSGVATSTALQTVLSLILISLTPPTAVQVASLLGFSQLLPTGVQPVSALQFKGAADKS